MSVTLSVSFNWGADYSSFSISYVNNFRQPFLSSIIPSISPRKLAVLSIQGKYLTYASYCVMNSPAIGTYWSPITNITSDYEASCIVPQWIADNKNVMQLSITIISNLNESSSAITFVYHDDIYISKVTPSSGLTVGGDIVNVYLQGYYYGKPIYAKFGDLVQPLACILWQYAAITSVNCTVPTHANGLVRVLLSYDQINWFTYGGYLNESIPISAYDPTTYTFIPCPAGYTAHDFSSACLACPPGTYKPTSGIYTCAPCDAGTYNPYSGQANCTYCPPNTISFANSSSIYDCTCANGTYYNPIMDRTLDQTCLTCPEGAVCEVYNTTAPLAQFGYWYSSEDPYHFYSCFPMSACPGGPPNNCSQGYMAQVCGQCQHGFYKSRHSCTECSPYSWALLVGGIVVIAILVLFFFHIASLRVAHISSISIASSFWQTLGMMVHFDVNWPFTVENTITAASVSNFNFDFLQPQCLFPDFGYTARWAFTSSLPLIFFAMFVLLYILVVIRTLFANRLGKYIRAKYTKFWEVPIYEDRSFRTTVKVYMLQSVYFWINLFIWIGNFNLWFFKQGMTRRQLRYTFNRCVNSFTAFVSFSFIYIFTSASDIFICTVQPNGDSTLNSSPDIFCYKGTWYQMLPVTIALYAFFGIGTLSLFLYVFIRKKHLDRKVAQTNLFYLAQEEPKELPKSEFALAREKRRLATLWKQNKDLEISVTNFNQMFQYVFRRFQKKYFYYEFVVLLRKLILSLLYIFLKPLLVIIFAIFILMVSLLIHLKLMPYRMKFHNMIDYIVLIATLLVLFFGLLFFVNDFPAPWMNTAAVYLTTGIIIGGSILVALLIVWDIQTRRRKEALLRKRRREQLLVEYGAMKETELRALYRKQFPSLWMKMQQSKEDQDDDDDPWVYIENEYAKTLSEEQWEEEEWIVMPNPLVEDPIAEREFKDLEEKEVEFALPFYLSDEDSGEEVDKPQALHELTEDLFGPERVSKKIQELKSLIKKQKK
jgi:hypothetical protein